MSLTEVLSNPESISGDDARAVMEFEKMRFELSWRHFDFHARQRTQLFHFFIILTPFVFGGCFIVFKDRHLVGYWPCVIAPIAGACLSFIFFLLDRRNKQLYRVSEEALRALEAQFFYTDYRPIQVKGKKFTGVMTTEEDRQRKRWFGTLRGHSFLMGAVYWIAIMLFVTLAMYFAGVWYTYVKLPAL